MRSDTRGFQREAQSGIMGTIKRVAVGAAAVFGGLALGKALFVDPIRSAAQFEQTLNVLKATTGGTDAQMKAVSATAMKLGADITLPGTSAGDAAAAMLELAKGGLTVKQSMDAARGTLIASAAAQIDNAQAAKIVAGALGAFGLQGTEAGRVANVLAGAANASTGEMTDYAQGLQQVGASAHQLHVPLEDTVAALAEMSRAGIQGSDAGTSLKTMFQRLNPTTKAAKDLVDRYNLSAFDQRGNFIGLSAVADKYRGVLSKMTPQQRQSTLQTIFGTDAVRASNIILGQGGAAFDKMRAAVSKQGQAQKLAAAQNAGFQGAMDGLRSTVETLQLQIGLKLLPVLTTFVRWLSANLPAAVNGAIAVISGFIAVIAAVVGFLQQHQNVLTALIAVLAGATAAYIAYNAWVLVLSTTLRIAAAAQAVFNAVMSLNPVGLVVVAIAALIAILVVLYTRNQTVRNAVDATWGFIRKYVPQAIAVVKGAIQSAISFLQQFWARNQALRGIVQQVWNGIRAIITGNIQIAKDIVLAVVAVLHGRWGDAWHQISKIPGDALRQAIGAIKGLGGAFLSAAYNIGKSIVTGILNGVGGLLGSLKDKLESEVKGALDSLNPFSPVEHGGAKYIGEPIVAGALAGLTGLGRQVRSAVNGELAGALPAAGGGVVRPAAATGAAVGVGVGDAGDTYNFNGPVTFQPAGALPSSQDDLRSVVRKLHR